MKAPGEKKFNHSLYIPLTLPSPTGEDAALCIEIITIFWTLA